MKQIVMIFLTTMFFGQLCFAQFQVVVNIEFSDTEETGKYIKVEKTDSERIFYICSKKTSDCENINRISVREFEFNEDMLDNSWNLPKGVFSVGGGLIGVLGTNAVLNPVGSFGSFLRGDRAAQAVTLVAVVIGAGIGYSIADGVDGKEFSTIETAAIRGTFARSEVLHREFSGNLVLDQKLETFRSYLITAVNAIIDRRVN